MANSNRSQLQEIVTGLGWPEQRFLDKVPDMRTVLELTAPRQAQEYSRPVSKHPRFTKKPIPDDEPSRLAIEKGLELMDQLICFDPEDRLTSAQAIDHPYFKVVFPSTYPLPHHEPTDHPVAAHKFDDVFEDSDHTAEEWYSMVCESMLHWRGGCCHEDDLHGSTPHAVYQM